MIFCYLASAFCEIWQNHKFLETCRTRGTAGALKKLTADEPTIRSLPGRGPKSIA